MSHIDTNISVNANAPDVTYKEDTQKKLNDALAEYILVSTYTKYDSDIGRNYISFDYGKALTNEEKLSVLEKVAFDFLNKIESETETRSRIIRNDVILDSQGNGTVSSINSRVDDDQITQDELINWAEYTKMDSYNFKTDALSMLGDIEIKEMYNQELQKPSLTLKYEKQKRSASSLYEESKAENLAAQHILSIIPDAFQDLWLDYFDTKYSIDDLSKGIANSMLSKIGNGPRP